MSSSLKQILDALHLLTTPERRNDKDLSTDNTKQNHFDHLLQRKLSQLHQNLTSGTFPDLTSLSALQHQPSTEVAEQSEIRWIYTVTCLYLLLHLKKEMVSAVKKFQEQLKQNPPSMKTPHQAPPLSPDVLSIEQEKNVLTTLQFIVCLGICPNLDKGVGIPLERRSGFGTLLGGSELREITDEEKYARLGLCGRVLVDCLQVSSLGALILSRHLNDLLAVLLQLNHSSGRTQTKSTRAHHSDTVEIQKIDGDKAVGKVSPFTHSDIIDTHPHDSVATSLQDDSKNKNISVLKYEEQKCDSVKKSVVGGDECVDMLLSELEIAETDQEFGESSLQRLMTRVSPPLLVRDLVMLQGGAKPRTNVEVKGAPLPVSPPWLRQVCGRLMTDILMRPKGLLYVLQGMLPPASAQTGSKGADAGDWKKCQAVAIVIAHCPMQTSSIEEYYKHLSPQIVALLHHSDKNTSRHYLRVLVTLVKLMNQQQSQLVQCHLLDPILKPLYQCINAQEIPEGSQERAVVMETVLSLCIQDIHKMYVSSTEAQTCMWPALSRCIPVLFHLYCSCKTGVSHLRSPCEEILTTFLKQADPNISLEFIWLLTTGIHGNQVKDVPLISPYVAFKTGESGGMIGVLIPDSNNELPLDSRVQSLVELVKHLQDLTVAGDFFIKLLQELTMMVSTENKDDIPKSSSPCEEEQTLYFLEQQDRQEVELFNRRLIVLNLLASMCEELDSSCLKKTQQILEFVRATLQRGVQVCRATTEELTGLFESETLSMAMGLLTAVMGGAVQVDEKDREAMQELLPLLDEIRHDHGSDEVREMADDLRIAIATRGAVWSDLMKNKTDLKTSATRVQPKDKKRASDIKPVRPLIEVIQESSNVDKSNVMGGSENKSTVNKKTICSEEPPLTSELIDSAKKNYSEKDKSEVHHNGSENSSTSGRSESVGKDPEFSQIGDAKHQSTKKEVSELEQSFKELCDPEIPVRGHGLLRLTHLIQNKDPSTLSRTETLLKVFEENLQHQDSYLYLASVNGLAALADQCPESVVPRLAREFADFDSGPRKKSPEVRMKLGESLMKSARSLGDMIPKYRDLLLAAILSGARSDEALVRASSLSNLAEVCRLLRFSLGSVLHEVFTCCSSVVKTDPDDEARKAAMMTITQLLQGLGQDTPKVLESVLRDLYRLLKLVHTSDSNDMVRTHALLALNELDTIMRNALFPQQKLEKKITVLHPD